MKREIKKLVKVTKELNSCLKDNGIVHGSITPLNDSSYRHEKFIGYIDYSDDDGQFFVVYFGEETEIRLIHGKSHFKMNVDTTAKQLNNCFENATQILNELKVNSMKAEELTIKTE